MNPLDCNDPLGYLDELREALASPMMQRLFSPVGNLRSSIDETGPARFDSSRGAFPTPSFGGIARQLDEVLRWEMAAQVAENVPEATENALSIVLCLGFCRLYGIELPSDIKSILVSPLPPELLVPAIGATLQILDSATDDARELPERFDDAEPLEDRSYCTSLLHILMECWAVYVVVDEEYQRHLCACQGTESRFGRWMRRLLDALAALDDQLQQEEQVRLLSVATELPLLDNWRKMLVEPYRDPIPWWLDGTLEAVADQVRQFIEADQTIKPVAIRPRPHALALLADRNAEIAARQACSAPGANVGEVTGPAAEALDDQTWRIVGEQNVRVRLALRAGQNVQRLLVVALIGTVMNTKKYKFVEVGFRSSPTQEVPFQLGCASLPLDANEIDGIVSLAIVDNARTQLQVNLVGVANGTS